MAVVSFARGIPAPDLLPVDDFAAAARAALARDGRAALNYGPPGGYPPLRELVAAWHGVDPARIVLTNGSLQGFAFVARHVLRDGGRVVVEAPTYDRSLHALRGLRADVDPVRLADDGLDVDALVEALDRGPAPRFVYTIPTFQNPSGRTLSLANRRRLVELAAERNLLLFEDDPYGRVRFEGEPLPSLHQLAGDDRVVFSSSFSKTVAPGIRVGYLVLPEALVAPVERIVLETYVSPSIFAQAALHEFLASGRFEENLDRVRAGLHARRDAMLAALARELPAEAGWNEPEGGYFLWLDLPRGVAAAALLARGLEAGVAFVPGSDFYAGSGGEEAARLAFSFASPDEIGAGIARLGRLVHEAAAVAA